MPNPTPLPPELREAFEIWAKERGHPLCDVIPKYGPASSSPDTVLRFSDIAWEAYQAADKAATERAARKCEDRAAAYRTTRAPGWHEVDHECTQCAAAIRAQTGGEHV